jgi:hypothetical protein
VKYFPLRPNIRNGGDMVYQAILDEVEHFHGVSGRLEGLADQHPRATEELLSIAGNVQEALCSAETVR